MSAPATRAASYWTGSENYVADRIMEELAGLIGDVRSDIIVDTTVDLTLQKLAEKSIRRLIDENGEKLNVSQGALVSIDNSGAVRAMVGGYDYANSQFDRASRSAPPAGLGVQAVRLPGRARAGPHARQRAQRRADQDRQLDARQLQRQIFRQGHAGDRAGEIAEFGCGAAGHGSRPDDSRVEAAHRLGIESNLQANTSIALGTSEVTPLELTAPMCPSPMAATGRDVHFIHRVTTT